jgi:beta-lactamase regulating signal transducer with metallopeptidase domain
MPFISQSNFLQALGWAVVNSLWQMALLWLIYKFFSIIAKPGSALKSKSAFIVLLAGTAWFIFSFIKAFISPATETLFTRNNISYSLNDTLTSILPFASILYLLLLALPVVRFIISLRQVMHIRTKKIKKIEIQWRLFVKKMSDYLEIHKPVQVWISETISTPVTVGFLKPVILVPLAAVNQLSTQQMEAVLLHELAHIKRYDYLVNIITVIIKTIFYFNPFTRSLANVIEEEREKSCDEWVLQYQYDAFAYSSALLALEQMKRHSLQLALAAASNRELLLERIKKIMGIPSAPVYSVKNNLKWISGIAGSALIFVLLFTNSFIEKQSVQQNENYSAYAFANSTVNPELDLSFINRKERTSSHRSIRIINDKQNDQPVEENYLPAEEMNKYFTQAGFAIQEPVPVLDEKDEEQVKEAMEASKKIIKEVKLNELEAIAADALTTKEKQGLKLYFEKEIDKVNWDKMEEKLRTSYNNINWPQVNQKISTELKKIRLDSFINVYSVALSNIQIAKQELQEQNLKGIPDSRITVTALDSAKKVMEESLKQLKAVKEKKIIKL